MSPAPAVSVIVPTYQRRELVRGAVDSVLAQLFRDFELIVVDDGSTDGTAEALATYGDRVRVVRQGNGGAASARNAGLRVARGELVAFLDSDNRWLPEHLALVVDALDGHPEAVLAYALPTDRRRPPGSSAPRLVEPFPRLIVGNFVGCLSAAAGRRAAIAAAGGFDERLRVTEDADLWLALALGGAPFVCVPHRTVDRRVSADSLLASRRSGEYAAALEAGTARAIERLDGSAGGGQLEAWLQGRHAFTRALRRLGEGDEPALREELAAACRLLPLLSERPASIASHAGFDLPGGAGRVLCARRLATLARAWPDRDSGLPRALRRRAVATVLTAVEGRRLRATAARARTLMIRTERGPLRPLWGVAHEALARTVAAGLRGRDPRLSVYLRGSLGTGEPVYGLSDMDLALVAAGDDGPGRIESEDRRWRMLSGRLPSAGLIERPQRYGESELRAWTASTTFTDGAGADGSPPTRREQRRAAMGAERPLLHELTGGWRLIGGPGLALPRASGSRDERRLCAWLELQYWWLQAFRACVQPSAPWTPYACVKLVTEPARVWLWLARGERIVERRALIARALEELPEEERALRSALTLLDDLGRAPDAPLAVALESCARVSRTIAAWIATDVEPAGATEVRLVGGAPEEPIVPDRALTGLRRVVGDGERRLPLVDWRARVWSLPPDECFACRPGDRLDPAVVAVAAVTGNRGAYTALRLGDLLVLPSLRRARLRGAQCPVTDPVSFALLDGATVAGFPDVPGWSARDSARRAVSEHLGWFEAGCPRDDDLEGVGRMFTAARAALFMQSLEAGDPELTLTVAAVAERLGSAPTGSGAPVLDASEAYAAGRAGEGPPPKGVLEALGEVVRRLPAYRGSGGRSRA